MLWITRLHAEVERVSFRQEHEGSVADGPLARTHACGRK